MIQLYKREWFEEWQEITISKKVIKVEIKFNISNIDVKNSGCKNSRCKKREQRNFQRKSTIIL